MPMPVAKVRWKCETCQKTFWLKPHAARTKRFCSRRCLHDGLRVENPVRPGQRHKTTYGERACERCQQSFIAKSVTQKYCSQACSVKAVWERNRIKTVVDRPCEYCGEMFRPRPENAGRFCSRKCTHQGQKGEKSSGWRGGKHSGSDGYVRAYAPDHPKASGHGGYVKEHRLVMERMLGRYLLPGENVHHKNGDRADNREENLELWVKSQPRGQRAEDAVSWAREIIKLYGEMFPEPEDSLTTK